jgi:hypothetical protein
MSVYYRSNKQKLLFNKYKTFSVLIYSYINTSGHWENEKLCEILVFPISTRVDITVYLLGKCFIFVNSQAK